MKILIVYAHHNPRSFCHAILERFTAGLSDAGHPYEIVDLHAIGFDPVLTDRDGPNWVDDSIPDDVLDHMNVKQSLLESAGNVLRRFVIKRWIGKKSAREIMRAIHNAGGPVDVKVQQEKVKNAEALVFISPVYFVGFPAILKGWIDRVFSLGFAFGFKPEAWRGDISGRLPLLTHRKALIINTTIFDEVAYKAGLSASMKVLIDEFCLSYPGIQNVEHVYFHAVYRADSEMRQAYLEKAYQLGKHFGD
jgi:NAD(P)H dehydrogenase (quinone)